MITELKKSWKLLKYAYQVKANVALAVFIVVLGILWLLVEGVECIHLGICYIFMGPTMLVQVQYNTMQANLVAASPQRRCLDSTFPDILVLISCVAAYLLGIVYLWVYSLLNPQASLNYGMLLITTAVTMVVVLLYFSVAYKSFLIGTLSFIFGFVLVLTSGITFVEKCATQVSLSAGALIGLGLVLVGNAGAVLLRRALYKKPISPFSGGMMLRKAMQ